jgi:flagellar hook-length control protein FliK
MFLEAVAQAQRQLFLARLLLMQAAVAAAATQAFQQLLGRAAPAVVETDRKVARDQTEQPTQAAVAVVAVIPRQLIKTAAQAAPASSSCRTRWPRARRSSSNPRQRGKPLLVRLPLII